MPRVYRSMFHRNGVPIIEDSADGLGIRTGQSHDNDIDMDENGLVHPGTGGMSVSPHWRLLPSHRIPKRLHGRREGARGKNGLACFAFGDGDFIAGPLHPGLILGSLTSKDGCVIHGCVEPEAPMTLDDYRKALASTQSVWAIDEL